MSYLVHLLDPNPWETTTYQSCVVHRSKAPALHVMNKSFKSLFGCIECCAPCQRERLSVCVCVYLRVCAWLHKYVCACMYMCLYTFVLATYTHVYVCVYLYRCMCMCTIGAAIEALLAPKTCRSKLHTQLVSEETFGVCSKRKKNDSYQLGPKDAKLPTNLCFETLFLVLLTYIL